MKKPDRVISLLVSCAFAAIGAWSSESADRTIAAAASPPFSKRLSMYFADRGRDFLDTFKLHVGMGLILSADLEVTELAHLGLAGGLSGVYSVEESSLLARASYSGFPLSNLNLFPGLLVEEGSESEGWRRFLVCHGYSYHSYYGDVFHPRRSEEHRCALVPLLFTLHSTAGSSHFGPPSPKEEPPIRWADCAGGAIVFPFALRVGVSPGEMLDFVAGWFGLDLAGDDNRSKQP